MLKDSEPVTEGKHLRPKLGIVVEADPEKVSEEPDEHVGEVEGHWPDAGVECR